MIGCSINTEFTRPSRDLVAAFQGIPVANIDDCMSRMAALCEEIHPFNKAPLLGTAFTVKVPAGDNLMFHKAMDLAQPGDVVVIDAGGGKDRAIFGELMISYCRKRGLAGAVLDGTIRDSEALSQMDFPVYARGVSPNGPYKNGPGEIGSVISCGGVVIYPGDIIVGDQDGVLSIRPHEAEALLAAVKKVMAMESGYMDEIMNKGTYIRPWVDEKLKEIGCTWKE